jgi:hypothetical protein
LVAERVIVPRRFAVIAGTVATETDLADQALILEVSQRIVDCRERDAWQQRASALEDLVGCQVPLGCTDHPQHGLTLFSDA